MLEMNVQIHIFSIYINSFEKGQFVLAILCFFLFESQWCWMTEKMFFCANR
jgi:hypothetical protein